MAIGVPPEKVGDLLLPTFCKQRGLPFVAKRLEARTVGVSFRSKAVPRAITPSPLLARFRVSGVRESCFQLVSKNQDPKKPTCFFKQNKTHGFFVFVWPGVGERRAAASVTPGTVSRRSTASSSGGCSPARARRAAPSCWRRPIGISFHWLEV